MNIAQFSEVYRRKLPEGRRAGLLFHSSLALIPMLIVIHMAWIFWTANLRAIGMLLVSLFYAGPLSWFLYRRSQGLEAVFFVTRTHPDQEEEPERLLYDGLGLVFALLCIALPFYYWFFK